MLLTLDSGKMTRVLSSAKSLASLLELSQRTFALRSEVEYAHDPPGNHSTLDQME
jgi:hypothetical protein